jgi:hypothetical protein
MDAGSRSRHFVQKIKFLAAYLVVIAQAGQHWSEYSVQKHFSLGMLVFLMKLFSSWLHLSCTGQYCPPASVMSNPNSLAI